MNITAPRPIIGPAGIIDRSTLILEEIFLFSVECKNGSLFVYLNGKQVIRHTSGHPFVVVGMADPVSGRITDKSSLTSAEYDEARSVIRFFDSQSSMSFGLSMKNGSLILTPQRTTIGVNHVWLNFPASPGEAVYGGGMQYSSLNLRGNKYPVWVSGSGAAGRRFGAVRPLDDLRGSLKYPHATPFPQPTFVSSSLYFIHIDSTSRMLMDFTSGFRHRVEIWDIPSRIVVGAFDDTETLFKHMSGLFGKQTVLPSWCCEGAWIEIEGGQSRMMERLEKAVTNGVAVSALLIRDWTGLHTVNGQDIPFWDWAMNTELYPHLYEIIRELISRNIRVLAYINPHLAIEGRLFAEASSKGYLIKKPSGGNYLNDMGGFMAGHLDLTNPSACAWYKEIIINNILKSGFSGYMADYGDFLPHDAVLYSKENPRKIHNQWPILWAKLNKEAIMESGKSSESVFFTRSGFSGSPSYSFLSCTGEHTAGWGKNDGLPSALCASLSLAWTGVSVSHSEIGGSIPSIFGARSKELITRWCEYAAFTPIMRVSDRPLPGNNFNFDSDRETLLHFAKMSRLHAGLEPYFRTLIKESATNGMPVMRPMSMAFADMRAPGGQRGLLNLRDQYMLGSDMLVAPMLKRGQRSRKVVFPEGNWVHIWTGKTFSKGEHEVDAPIGKPAAFYAADSKYASLFTKIIYEL